MALTNLNWNGHNFLKSVPTKELFIKEFTQLCKKYDVSLSHEDTEGSFILYKGYNDEYIQWISHATVPNWEEGE